MDNTLLALVNALRCLPGVGPKSAQRMVYHLLGKDRDRGIHLASRLKEAMTSIQNCECCNNYTSLKICVLCSNTNRDRNVICVVESPADVQAIEQSGSFDGLYYILMGKVSPLDGIGPEEIGLPKLLQRITTDKVQEVIVALNASIEGQTTSYFIYELLRDTNISVSQLAQGIPTGGELEFLDGHTIGSALRNRMILNHSL